MSTDSDPLLRAVANEDPACPDGRRLAALGRLFRLHSAPRPVELADDVLARINDLGQHDAEAIDAFYDRGDAEADPALGRLAELARAIRPAPIDCSAQVLKRIRASSRFAVFNQPESRDDGTRRWRIWSAVVAGHFAALLAFAIFEVGFGRDAGGTPGTGAAAATGPAQTVGEGDATHRAGAPALPPNLPATWSDIRGLGTDLFLLRRFPEMRQEARRWYGMEGSAAAVASGLGWIQGRQDAASGAFGTLSGNAERDLATQSLAVLALLGEGFGDKARTAAARNGLGWLRGRIFTGAPDDESGPDRALAELSPVTAGLTCLALVEGGLLFGDETLRAQAEQCLAAIDRGLPMQAGAAGLGGFSLLALETAQQGGLHVPGRLLQHARQHIARALPGQDSDAGRLGLAAFARFIYGRGELGSTLNQIDRLDALAPTVTSEHADPLGWFFATLALREAGGKHWQQWSTALQGALSPLVTSGGAQAGRVDPALIRFGETGGEVFATSLVVLNLQAPYRYLPLAPSTR
jgi:hypothetical protein